MIEQIQIENYKTVENLSLALGRVNVFIGENGAGKSNILEAIALAAAAESDKLDNEFLASRGIRVSSAKLMRSAFKQGNMHSPIIVTVKFAPDSSVEYELTNDNKPYSSWTHSTDVSASPTNLSGVTDYLRDILSSVDDEDERNRLIKDIAAQIAEQAAKIGSLKDRESGDQRVSIKFDLNIKSKYRIQSNKDAVYLRDFLIYSPENTTLRTYEREGQIEPLGINGEGLLRYLEIVYNQKDKQPLDIIKGELSLFDWFKDLKIRKQRSSSVLKLEDNFFDGKISGLDQRSANEGFLYVAFYLSLLTTKLTPSFFAIDNVDTALNPRMCERIIQTIVRLAKSNDKQLIVTTHNPAILDGLDLNDDSQRLFVISRSASGQTRARRFQRKSQTMTPTRLSEHFISGALGGLPKNF